MRLVSVFLLGLAVGHSNAQRLVLSPTIIDLPADASSFIITDAKGGNLKFKYAGVSTDFNAPNFIVVVPSAATTPVEIRIGLNSSILAQLKPGGIYSLTVGFTTTELTPASTVGGIVHLRVPTEPPPGITSVVNAASLQPSLSPGALVSIIGSHLTGPTLSTAYDDTARYPTSVADTTVTFNSIAAPLLFLSPSQINAIVPYALAGQASVEVVVKRFEMVSAAFTLPLQETSPGIFTATQTGSGQGAILQQGSDAKFTYNSSDNPATAGMALEIFATGAGVWTPPAQSDVFIEGAYFRTQPVSVTIGGQPAKVLYAGTPGTQGTWSTLQVNAVVPDGLASGPQPVVLKIGAADNSRQDVTVWIK